MPTTRDHIQSMTSGNQWIRSYLDVVLCCSCELRRSSSALLARYSLPAMLAGVLTFGQSFGICVTHLTSRNSIQNFLGNGRHLKQQFMALVTTLQLGDIALRGARNRCHIHNDLFGARFLVVCPRLQRNPCRHGVDVMVSCVVGLVK